MRAIILPVAILLLPALAAASAPGTEDGAPALPGWMAGCWIADHGEGRQSEECWTRPRGAMMIGSGHMFRGARSLSFEHMRIAREADGLVFIAQPGGATATRFTLEPAEARDAPGPRISFVNARHDYPQRVTYWLEDGRLQARIAMLDGSRAMHWRFRRTDAARD